MKVTWTETEHYTVGKGDPATGLNGYGILTFPLTGGEIVENYYDDSGRLRYSCGVAATVKLPITAPAPGPQPTA